MYVHKVLFTYREINKRLRNLSNVDIDVEEVDDASRHAQQEEGDGN